MIFFFPFAASLACSLDDELGIALSYASLATPRPDQTRRLHVLSSEMWDIILGYTGYYKAWQRQLSRQVVGSNLIPVW